jgi:fatty acid desaturase (delta-4 desaturase)
LHTNEVHSDPDIAGSDLLRLNPLAPLLPPQAAQHLYFFGLILLFGHIMVLSSLWHVLSGVQFTPYARLLAPHRRFDAAASLLFIFRWFALPLLRSPSVWTLLNVTPMFAVGGYYLAFFFVISHNFAGVQMFDEAAPAAPDSPERRRLLNSFLYRQVTSSANVGGRLLAVVNGGLNFQIEHHLFPRMSHVHYHRIAPVVRQFCRAKGIPYVHFPTVRENAAACVAHLFAFGHKQRPVALNAADPSAQ